MGAIRFKPRQDVEDAFWRLVAKANGCWLWLGSTNNSGYGNFYCGGLHHAHRYSWALKNGDIPFGMQINHHCDNRLCVNPDHLYSGTKKQNSRDMIVRGRVSRGSNRPIAKLTESDIPFIRYWIKAGFKQDEIAGAFLVSQSAVHLINKRVTWGHA